jgi:hypothetical protein
MTTDFEIGHGSLRAGNMRRRNPVKKEKKVCSVCGSSSNPIYYKAIPPYKCGDCLYKERCPDDKLRAFSESLERANMGWGRMSAEDFYQSLDNFINGAT